MKRLTIVMGIVSSTMFAAITGCTTSAHDKVVEDEKVAATSLDKLVLKNQYALNVKLFNNVLKDISESESNQRINEQVNSVKWIVGHTLDIQYNLAALLGLSTENPYTTSFGYGKPFDPNGAYPALEGMIGDWNAIASKISEALESMEQKQLDAASPFPIPYNEQTIRGLLAFQMHHLGYEIGQLGLYRKYLSKTAMSYQ